MQWEKSDFIAYHTFADLFTVKTFCYLQYLAR